MAAAGVVKKDSIRVIAQNVGIEHLDDACASALASSVEDKIRKLVKNALKFVRHSHRKKLTQADINSALKLCNREPLYGYPSSSTTTREGGSSTSSNNGNNDDGSSGINSSTGGSSSSSGGGNSFRLVDGSTDLFFIEDDIINVRTSTNDFSQHIPSTPILPPSFSLHWLAVNGKQPRIPLNPQPSNENDNNKEIKGIEPILSREQMSLYDSITNAIWSPSKSLRTSALSILNEESGLQQLLPYLSRFVAEKIHTSLSSIQKLVGILEMLRALLYNPFIYIEPYLHQILSVLMTCVVVDKIGNDNEKTQGIKHWTIREYAARLLAYVCRRFGSFYCNLQPRLTHQLSEALKNPNTSLTTIYGAIVGLSYLNSEVIRMILTPHITNLVYQFSLVSSLSKNDDDFSNYIEANHCFNALIRAIGLYLRYKLQICKLFMGPCINIEISENIEEDDSEDDDEEIFPTSSHLQKQNFLPSQPPSLLLDNDMFFVYHDLFGEALIPFCSSFSLPISHVFV